MPSLPNAQNRTVFTKNFQIFFSHVFLRSYYLMPRTGWFLQKTFRFFSARGFLCLHYLMPRTGLYLKTFRFFFQPRFSAPLLPNAQDQTVFTIFLHSSLDKGRCPLAGRNFFLGFFVNTGDFWALVGKRAEKCP